MVVVNGGVGLLSHHNILLVEILDSRRNCYDCYLFELSVKWLCPQLSLRTLGLKHSWYQMSMDNHSKVVKHEHEQLS